jgi:hypothetical protein
VKVPRPTPQHLAEIVDIIQVKRPRGVCFPSSSTAATPGSSVLSTSEAEYMVRNDAAKEARSLLKLNVTLETNSLQNLKIF